VVEGKVKMAAGLWRVGEEGGDPSPLKPLCQLKQEGNMRWCVYFGSLRETHLTL